MNIWTHATHEMNKARNAVVYRGRAYSETAVRVGSSTFPTRAEAEQDAVRLAEEIRISA